MLDPLLEHVWVLFLGQEARPKGWRQHKMRGATSQEAGTGHTQGPCCVFAWVSSIVVFTGTVLLDA